MKKLRVLVVEDSLTVRRHLCGVLAADSDLEVVAEAENGKQAIELCQSLRPDVVSLDMMLPVMSGLAATEYIMAFCPTPILVVSSSTNRGELFRTYDALAAGAVDVLDKPLGTESDGEWERRFVAAVKLVARIKVITHPRARLGSMGRPLAMTAGPSTDHGDHAARVICIGASTGGPGAIVDILRTLTAPLTIPILVVVHIGEPFGTAFAEWLDGQTEHRVAFARDGERLVATAGRVVLAPPGRHLVVRDGRLRLTLDPERHSCRPSVDTLFDSIAGELGASAVACLLTGMGRDGAEGLLRIRQAGGLTIAQDETTSIVFGMPREAAMMGAATRVLPLDEIAALVASVASAARSPRLGVEGL
jgi:two-component system, chemotaxis family, protein-glutamate methylesterase/glutaminase